MTNITILIVEDEVITAMELQSRLERGNGQPQTDGKNVKI